MYCSDANLFIVFFKQKTAYEMRISDWSSDVCSSDLPQPVDLAHHVLQADGPAAVVAALDGDLLFARIVADQPDLAAAPGRVAGSYVHTATADEADVGQIARRSRRLPAPFFHPIVLQPPLLAPAAAHDPPPAGPA